MRPIFHFLLLLSALILIGGASSTFAATVGGGQPFTSLVGTSAGVLGVDENGIWLSTDNGASFNNVYFQPDERYFSLAATATTVIAVGEDGLVLRSINGGNDWTLVANPGLFGNLISVASDGEGIWLATGDAFSSNVLRSDDDGQSWSLSTAPLASGLRAIAWQADTQWILAGEDVTFGKGIVYQSIDNGENWQLLADNLDAPVNAVATNNNGEITIVGESGLFLQGTTAASFEAPDGYSPVSEDLYIVLATNSGSFVVGGESGTLLIGDESGVTNNSLIDGPDVTAIIIFEEENLLISGDYTPPLPLERTQPFELLLSLDAVSGDFILTIAETLGDRSYVIESSTNLVNWTEVVGSERAGNGGAQIWTFSANGPRLFWRAVEF